jgi:hypothetical protein
MKGIDMAKECADTPFAYIVWHCGISMAALDQRAIHSSRRLAEDNSRTNGTVMKAQNMNLFTNFSCK